MAEFTVRRASWVDDNAALCQVRRRVFIEEQCVPEELEWDGLDETSTHFLAEDDAGQAVGSARLLPDGHIGRMCVLKEWRGRGIGSALLREALAAAGEQGLARVELAAQVHALPFYERHGFTAEGGEFLDAGIPHRNMYRAL